MPRRSDVEAVVALAAEAGGEAEVVEVSGRTRGPVLAVSGDGSGDRLQAPVRALVCGLEARKVAALILEIAQREEVPDSRILDDEIRNPLLLARLEGHRRIG